MAYTNRYFPSQVVSDAEKISYEYGRKVAKAIEAEWFYDENNYRNNEKSRKTRNQKN